MNSDSFDGGFIHQPVLLDEVLEVLSPKPYGLYVDCTLGGGGHAAAVMGKAGVGARLIGIDRDAEAIRRCEKLFESYGGRVELFNRRFEDIGEVLAGREVDGILLDLGVSSFMLDDPDRGFSFLNEGPLDMRMDRSQKLTASDIVNKADKKELARIFREYGEEPQAGRVASRIIKERSITPIASTARLAELVKSALPYKYSRTNPATKVFQALRIAVNGELEKLEETVKTAVKHLKPGGRLAVISFHSLEDRIIKRTFKSLEFACECPPDFPKCVCGKTSTVKILTKKPVKPSEREISANPRSRSSLLRALEKNAA